MIRTAIREEQGHYRHRNVAKLLFMHMLGTWIDLDHGFSCRVHPHGHGLFSLEANAFSSPISLLECLDD